VLVTVPAPVPESLTVSVLDVVDTLNVAVTELLLLNITLHELVPLQAPDQPAKMEPAVGVGVSDTVDPLLKVALQIAPQLMPLGVLVTVPAPVPESVTVRVLDVIDVLKVAVTELLPLNVTLHEPAPLHAPDQPAKVEPVAAIAVRVTTAPVLNSALHVVPQVMPLGLLVTVPEPVPGSVTVSVLDVTDVLKVAVAELLLLNVALHEPVPLQTPDQPAKVEPAAAVAVSVTAVPVLKVAVHVIPQLMPVGLLVTMPAPLPVALTVSRKEVGWEDAGDTATPAQAVRNKGARRQVTSAIRRPNRMSCSLRPLQQSKPRSGCLDAMSRPAVVAEPSSHSI
jgi:hypothetical protein